MSDLLTEIKDLPCTDRKLIIFGRAHYSYINQIFGDVTVRAIIQEVMKKPGELKSKNSGREFGNSSHHFYELEEKMGKKRKLTTICSAENLYQNISIDKNDTLCQSYSLMTYLDIEFDKTPSSTASIQQKRAKHMSMIQMYRELLNNKEIIKKITKEVIEHKDNKKIWKDIINNAEDDYIIEKYKTGNRIINRIHKVIDIWEKYGWMYFIGKGKCIAGQANQAAQPNQPAQPPEAVQAVQPNQRNQPAPPPEAAPAPEANQPCNTPGFCAIQGGKPRGKRTRKRKTM
jgi:hypothetical protein